MNKKRKNNLSKVKKTHIKKECVTFCRKKEKYMEMNEMLANIY